MFSTDSVASGRRRPTGRCRHCGRCTFNGSKTCRARSCPGYGPLWAGDQRRKLFDNLVAFADFVRVKDPLVVMFAVTAPGGDVLPWDRAYCERLGAHKCSGDLGCQVQRRAAREWNRTAPARWRELHRRAYVATTRAYGTDDALWMLCRVWEKQQRGVLHVHPVVACATPRQKAAAEHYRDRLEMWVRRMGRVRLAQVPAAAGPCRGCLPVGVLLPRQAGEDDAPRVGHDSGHATVDCPRLDPADRAHGRNDAGAAVSSIRVGPSSRHDDERRSLFDRDGARVRGAGA
jgi:hypothetical protein